jgi:hypothetical protein
MSTPELRLRDNTALDAQPCHPFNGQRQGWVETLLETEIENLPRRYTQGNCTKRIHEQTWYGRGQGLALIWIER